MSFLTKTTCANLSQRICKFSRRWSAVGSPSVRLLHTGKRMMAEEEEKPQPYSYLKSQSSQRTSFETFELAKDVQNRPKYQTEWIVGSMVVLLLYFGILREPNDLDEELEKTFFDRFPGMEEEALIGQIRTAKRYGYDYRDAEKRLAELFRYEEEKATKNVEHKK